MSNKPLRTGFKPGSIAWIIPIPTFPSLVLGTKAVSHTFTICNNGTVPVTITGIYLEPGDDSRLQIAGGSCCKGQTLLPQATVTIDVLATPRALGIVKEVLCIQHNGISSPLWIDIVFAVSRDLPATPKSASYLVDETRSMERQRRINEQEGHRKLARVHARAHSEAETQTPAPEGELQNNILQNPWLNSQRFDGVDPNLNPEPPLNTEARREFDNEQREQEMEKQLRLGNMPKFSTAPKPHGP